MTFHFQTQPGTPARLPPSVVVDMIRCWCGAKRQGVPTQPRLTRRLEALDCTVLAPVMDSFCSLFEFALGRPLHTGRLQDLSEDEQMMLSLLEGLERRAIALPCEEPRGTLLDLAIRSTRVMITLTLRQARRPTTGRQQSAWA